MMVTNGSASKNGTYWSRTSWSFFKKLCSTFNCPIYQMHFYFSLALMYASMLCI
jgi:hypothetical protein